MAACFAFVFAPPATYPEAVSLPDPAVSAPAEPGFLGRARAAVMGQIGHLLHEMAKFGVVGLVALVVDVGLFNLLLYHGGAPMYGKPIRAKIVSVAVATVVSYIGNRFWTFRHRDRVGSAREYVLFFLLNGVGMAIAVGCLAFSHYALGLTSQLADNIAANVIGLGLGTLFRFWAYRRWVFPEFEGDDTITAELRQPV